MPLHLSAMISSSDKEKIASLLSLGQGESQRSKPDSSTVASSVAVQDNGMTVVEINGEKEKNDDKEKELEELRGRQAFALAVATRHWFIEVQNAEIAYLWFFFTFFFLKFYFLSYKTVQFPLELKLRMQKDYMAQKVLQTALTVGSWIIP